MHEQSHWLLGHMDYLQEKYRSSHLSLRENGLETQAKRQIDAKTRYCIELQADSLATQLLFYYGLSDSFQNDEHLVTYKTMRSKYAEFRNSRSPSIGSVEKIFRLLLISACIGCILFEHQNEGHSWRSETHPPPSTRIINICADALASFGDVIKVISGNETGNDDYNVDILKPAMREVMLTLMDLDIVGRLIGLNNMDYRSDSTNKDSLLKSEIEQETPLAKDVFEVILTKREDRLITEGAKNFLSLEGVNKELYSNLEVYTKIR